MISIGYKRVIFIGNIVDKLKWVELGRNLAKR